MKISKAIIVNVICVILLVIAIVSLFAFVFIQSASPVLLIVTIACSFISYILMENQIKQTNKKSSDDKQE